MTARSPHRLRLAALRKDAPTGFDIAPSEAQIAAMKAQLDLLGLRKMRLRGEIAPEGRADWVLTAHLGATVVQPCSVTLEPVTTRLEDPVRRRYTSEYRAPTEGEAEMPDDETLEPLPEAIDLVDLAAEALALAVPAFPRKADVAPVEIQATPPGAAPLDDAAARPSPFAALSDLKRKMDE